MASIVNSPGGVSSPQGSQESQVIRTPPGQASASQLTQAPPSTPQQRAVHYTGNRTSETALRKLQVVLTPPKPGSQVQEQESSTKVYKHKRVTSLDVDVLKEESGRPSHRPNPPSSSPKSLLSPFFPSQQTNAHTETANPKLTKNAHSSTSLSGEPGTGASAALGSAALRVGKDITGTQEARNKAEAQWNLREFKAKLLQNHPDRLKKIGLATSQAFEKYPFKNDLRLAIENYVSPTSGYSFLMTRIVEGKHKTLKDMLLSINEKKYQAEQNVDEYCNEFIERHGLDDYDFTAEDLKEVFATDLQRQTECLAEFLTTSGVDLEGLTLARGVSTDYVDAKIYLADFINKKTLPYGRFVSASAALETALEFAGSSEIPDDPVGTLDVNDESPEALEHKHALEKYMATEEGDPDSATIFHFFQCKKLKGAFLSENTIGASIDEQEILTLKPTSIPQRIIWGEGFYALINELTHVPDGPENLFP